ncbi:M3 family oligoendopeptidase [uncultured Endozoicomonas sp.]|uniref:M3 family oligoendopeptidase n=1 Tax=uncultured Endozoicomonas sp. TaxID=432652 RepID=UPI00261F7247|nr:M3 family oligoendopeptidase [uncultured Endozoicomonas sp.]
MKLSVKSDESIPVWDNAGIYSGLDDAQIEQDIDTIDAQITELSEVVKSLKTNSSVSQISTALCIYSQAYILEMTVYVYAESATSVNTRDEVGAKLSVRMTEYESTLEQLFQQIKSVVLKLSEPEKQQLFAEPESTQFAFLFEQEAKKSDFDLSVKEEVTLAAMSSDGLHGWGRLYSELSGNIRCVVDGKELGLASAFNLTCDHDAEKRLKGWQAIQDAWRTREETAAAILNAINGWRFQERKLRSETKPLHYLDVTCFDQRIERQTLDTLMSATRQRRSLGHRALVGMAKGLGLEKLGPQDILAPCPIESDADSYYGFADALNLVAKAFDGFDPDMGDFARMMYDKGWIDAKASDNRETGGYCTSFASVREPRIFITWDGSIKDVITLAHELGHAWHEWILRDIPYFECEYPHTLAETASIFAETIVRDELFKQAQSDREKLQIAWEDAESAASFLVNIPARFEFEKRLTEARREGYVPASELSQMMTDSWEVWYGESLSGYDSMFWASKGHFSISELAFYNYPYLFGYLFSLGVYAQKDKQGSNFRRQYLDILKDTGRMTSEALIQKHLGKDIRNPEFWHESLDIVDRLISRFESLLGNSA